MNKIVNGVANDYEFPMYYESNIKTSRDKDSVIAMTYINQEKEIERLNNIINELEKWLNHSIESINEKLDNAKDKSRIIYSMNDYQILRLRTFRTKMNEVLDKLKELKGSDKE